MNRNWTRGTAGRRSPALIHKWNNLIVRYIGKIPPPPRVPIILIEIKHIWNITFRLIILGKLEGPGYTTNVHIFILGSRNILSFTNISLSMWETYDKVHTELSIKSPKRHNRGKTECTGISYYCAHLHIRILQCTVSWTSD